jgi:divalent metal cation (Fe/Co/Zn/Cd) transporter
MTPGATDRLRESGARVSLVGSAWTIAAGVAAVTIGITTGGLALIAFGAVGVLDAAGSITLAVHFRLAAESATRADRMERVALRVITTGLVVVGLATTAVSILHLADRHGAEQSDAGTAIALVSLVVLTGLALRKRWLARRIPSLGLLADSHLSAVGAVLAAVTLIGEVLTETMEWWWADPVAAIVVAVAAVRLGFVMARAPVPST